MKCLKYWMMSAQLLKERIVNSKILSIIPFPNFTKSLA